jgi:acyl-coenzyme A synthetase/AMP-(fatty) acid ligase
MFRGYLNNEERYRKCFAGDWYLTGDLVGATRTATSGSSAAPTT